MKTEEARKHIGHSTDGPVDSFVLISRACRLASHVPDAREHIANALYEELLERGMLNSGHVKINGS